MRRETCDRILESHTILHAQQLHAAHGGVNVTKIIWSSKAVQIQILTDNITTAAFINHRGGPSQALAQLATTSLTGGTLCIVYFHSGRILVYWRDYVSRGQGEVICNKPVFMPDVSLFQTSQTLLIHHT